MDSATIAELDCRTQFYELRTDVQCELMKATANSALAFTELADYFSAERVVEMSEEFAKLLLAQATEATGIMLHQHEPAGINAGLTNAAELRDQSDAVLPAVAYRKALAGGVGTGALPIWPVLQAAAYRKALADLTEAVGNLPGHAASDALRSAYNHARELLSKAV